MRLPGGRSPAGGRRRGTSGLTKDNPALQQRGQYPSGSGKMSIILNLGQTIVDVFNVDAMVRTVTMMMTAMVF